MTKSNRSVAQRVLNPEVKADHHQRYHVWETPVATVHRYGCGATSVLRVSAVRASRLRIRENELMKQHTKQTAADHSQAENEPRKLSSLHTKHDVN
eukprot:6211976-Pleurochrysis_carterae.AAC.2